MNISTLLGIRPEVLAVVYVPGHTAHRTINTGSVRIDA